MIDYWARHVCVACGGAYRYPLARAKARARRRPAPEMRPCPACGCYQPDMIASRRTVWHLLVGCGSCVAAVVLAGVGTDHYVDDRVTMWAGVALGAVALLIHLAVALWNPNRNLPANRARAKGLMRAGELELLRDETPGRASARLPRWGAGPLHGVALGGLALGLVLFVAGDLLRLACGWPLNPAWYPGVAGPGDEPRFIFPQSLSSVKGYWNGRSEAFVLNPADAGLDEARLPTTTHHDSWGGTLYAKDDEMNRTSRPWVEVQVPDSPRLAGRRLRVQVELVASHPVLSGNTYVDEEAAFSQVAPLHLADRPGAGELYKEVWHGGAFGGAAWLLLMSLLFVLANWRLRRQAVPLKVVEEGDDDDDDDEDRWRRRRRPRRRYDYD